jgi:hypothetical protein
MATATDWDDRRLCPDGTCIGVLDHNGICRTCGRKGGHPVAARPADSDEVVPVSVEPDAPVATAAPGDAPAAGPADDDDRQLCPSGTCIGLIGQDGRCSECGRRADNRPG